MFAADPLPAIALVSSVSFLVYYNSLWGGFVFDDHRAILTNDDLDAEKTELWGLFVNDFWGGHMSRTESHKSYRPLTVLTYRCLNFWFSQLEPFSYHLVNIVLHCVASVLFFLVCRRLLGRNWPSLYAAILFSVHSIHTESVSLPLIITIFIPTRVIIFNADCKCCRESRDSCLYFLSPQPSPLHERCLKREWKDARTNSIHKMAVCISQYCNVFLIITKQGTRSDCTWSFFRF